MEILLAYAKCFLVGGLLCAVGQVLIDKTALTPARILTLFVVSGVLLSALGLYGPLADWAGAGATVDANAELLLLRGQSLDLFLGRGLIFVVRVGRINHPQSFFPVLHNVLNRATKLGIKKVITKFAVLRNHFLTWIKASSPR